MKNQSRQQQGRILVIVLIVAALGVAFSIYRVESNKSAKVKEEQQVAAVEAERVRTELAEKDKLAKQELAATVQRLAAEKKTDALLSTLRAVDDVYAKWQDALKVADSTGRMALAAPVAALQALRREAEALTVPPCLDAGKLALVSGMTDAVDGYLVFMQNPAKLGEALGIAKFEEAAPKLAVFKAARADCPTAAKP